MKNTALITGASSGIGRELAWVHAEHGGDLVLIARRGEVLEELKQQIVEKHKVNVMCIAVDLNEPGAVHDVYNQVDGAGIEVDILINNAGFGNHGPFYQHDWKTDGGMIHLNVTVLSEMTHRFMQGMLERQHGRILNVGSTAGFLPGPMMAVYYASKAYVLSFSQAIAEEVSELGVTVTALCPGPVETEFFQRAHAKHVGMFKKGATATARGVAELGYRAMKKGRLVVINEWRLWFLLNFITPCVPRRTLLKISKWLLSS